MANEIYGQLAARFPTSDHKTVKKGGREQTYIPWTDKVDRFNQVLGQDWSFRVVREGMTETEAWVLGEVSVTIGGVTTVRQQYGCEAIAKGQNKTPTTDLFKIAGTDALSKAATLFGCGLYLSIQEERAEVEAEMAAEKRRPTPIATSKVNAAAQLTGAPGEPEEHLKTKAELIAELRTGIAYARTLGIEAPDVDCGPLNRAEIEETTEALRGECRAVRAAKRQQAS